MAADAALSVLRNYPLPPPDRVDSLGNAGGFSGASLWRISVGPAQFCLRQWPQGTKWQRLAAIHRVLEHVTREGFAVVPRPLRKVTGGTIVACEDRLWDLAPWLPGEAERACPPSPERLRAAMQALARFHGAAQTYPGGDEFPAAGMGQPPGLLRRAAAIRQHLQAGLKGLENAPLPNRWDQLRSRRPQLLELFRAAAPLYLPTIERAASAQVPLQVCLRDVWSAHVLFRGDEVTGLIDFDAMKVDSVATDIARLLGSFAEDRDEAWLAGITAYEEVRSLNAAERIAIAAYDQAAVLLTGVQWLDWIVVERRDFDPSLVVPRLDATILRLEHLNEQLRTARSRLRERD